jgi:hypothetical protein
MPKFNSKDKPKTDSKKEFDIHFPAIDYGSPHVHVIQRSKKKLRGWRIKKIKAVKVSKITEDGFWVHTYLNDYYIPRILFPWFLNANDNAIRNIELLRQHRHDGHDEHGDLLYWKKLNVDIGTLSIEYPQLLSMEKRIRNLQEPERLEQFNAEIHKRGWQKYILSVEEENVNTEFFAKDDDEAVAIAHWHMTQYQPKAGGYSYQLRQQERLVHEHNKTGSRDTGNS